MTCEHDLQVELHRRASVAACVSPIFNHAEQSQLAAEFFKHMRQMRVNHFHAYVVDTFVDFDDNNLGWHMANSSRVPPEYQGVEWTYVQTFDPSLRCELWSMRFQKEACTSFDWRIKILCWSTG